MIFGEFPLEEAAGSILAHSLRAGDGVLKKGRFLTPADLALLESAGISSVTVARLEAGDVHEDAAARSLAERLAGPGLKVGKAFTGRCNLIAEAPGLLRLDPARLHALNGIDEAITLATLPAYAVVEPGQIAATVKIIPFAVKGDDLESCFKILGPSIAPLDLAPFHAKKVGLIQTLLMGAGEKLLAKTKQVVDARLHRMGSPQSLEARCQHRVTDLQAAIEQMLSSDIDLLLVSGASAIVDRRDVVPSAILRAGGTLDRLGMPVDPGNLILIGHRDKTQIIGLPGCARSPKLNGIDWVLERLIADIPVTISDIAGMGIGGLLKEMAGRPSPRAGSQRKRSADKTQIG